MVKIRQLVKKKKKSKTLEKSISVTQSHKYVKARTENPKVITLSLERAAQVLTRRQTSHPCFYTDTSTAHAYAQLNPLKESKLNKQRN